MNRMNGVSRRTFLKTSAAAGGLAASQLLTSGTRARAADDAGEIVVLGWSVYWSPEMIALFKEKTGITLKIIGADTDQEIFTKLQTGGTGGYDVVYANAGWTPLYFKAGLIEPVSLAEVATSQSSLYPAFGALTSLPYVLEPAKTLLFYPNMWSPMALLWRRDLQESSSEMSWSLMWDAKIPKGTVMFQGGAGDDFLALAALAHGVAKEKLYDMDSEQLKKAIADLRRLKPFQVVHGLPDVVERFKTNKATVGMVSELGLAAKVNNALGDTLVDAAIPKEGALGWVDGAMLVKQAKNRGNAIKMMEFMGSDPDYLRLLFKGNVSGMCSRTGAEVVIAGGGEAATNLKNIGGDNPDLAAKLIMTSPPKDPVAYSSAWDQVLSS